jgi:hypothetical protein
MKKEVKITIDQKYCLYLEQDYITFLNNCGNRTANAFPIEVFYQMWNSDELISHMEQYHKNRKVSDDYLRS